MRCPKCGHENQAHYAFCLSCGGALSHPPAGEPGGQPVAWPGQAQQPPQAQSQQCRQCGGGRIVQGAVGPQLGVRVFTPGRHDDVPLAPALVCVDCGHVSLFLPDDARRYLAGLFGR